MADINKVDIKLMESQRLDDTDQGGGQMTSHEVQDGEVNNLFPDISRLDRVYGRVSMRKAYLAVQTTARETYYGSHTILSKQADDPNVSVCFFSSENWFDTRDDAKDRIEAYLVKGPRLQMSLWGKHYKGSSLLKYYTGVGWSIPEVGDVIVLINSSGDEQYVRATDVSSSQQEFTYVDKPNYYRQVVDVEIGSQLEYDFEGEEMEYDWDLGNDGSQSFETVAADASKYYGVSTLVDDALTDDLQIRVDDIKTHLVPSAQSETPITDAGVGNALSPMIQTQDPVVSVTRSITYNISTNAKLHIGEGVKPGTFSWSGGLSLTDNGRGGILSGENIIGSISYATGIITFGQPGTTAAGTGTATYVPACSATQISETGGIQIETNNRGFAYVFSCDPIPERGTLKVDYLAGGKWYTIWDQGDGQIAYAIDGEVDSSLGTGSLNFTTGSVSLTLGAMPDVGSQIIFYWAKPSEYYDLAGEVLPIRYKFNTNNDSVARNTFEMIWTGDGNGPGPSGEYAIVDDGNSFLRQAKYTAGPGWEVDETVLTELGRIKYATGAIDTLIGIDQFNPVASEVFTINYSYGEKYTDSFFAPARDGSGRLNIELTNTPIIPGTFEIEWHNDIVEYDPETRIDMTRDPTYIFQDDGAGLFDGDVNDGTMNWVQGSVNYTTGDVRLMPDRNTVFPVSKYKWVVTAWLHPGVEESRVFTHIDYLATASLFPAEGTVTCKYCTVDGSNQDSYTGTISPIYLVKPDKALEIHPGGLRVTDASGNVMIDGTDGRLYTHFDGVSGDKVHVGNISYANKSFSIISDNIDLNSMTVTQCVGTASINPKMSMVFRTPGAPVKPGQLIIRATNGQGTLLEGTANFAGDIVGEGVAGHIDFDTGLCNVAFGIWVPDDAEAQAADWYSATASDGAGNVWKPYMVKASTILINCVITSYLPLDPDLLGLDPVRLPLDGKVPIFRDGYIIVVSHALEETLPYPLEAGGVLLSDQVHNAGRGGVDLLEVYSVPTQKQIDDGDQTCPILVQESGNYTVNLTTGDVTFLTGFTLPKDSEGTYNNLRIFSKIEDMCLASDVQVTGHIAITNGLTHDYPAGETIVSSVLPSKDLQSRAYNEFEMAAWPGWTSEKPTEIGEPLASYNFVDYPITVTNMPSVKERWALIFGNTTQVDVVGENFGVLIDGATVIGLASDGSDLNEWDGIQSGVFRYGGQPYLIVANRSFSNEPFDNAYWMINCNGFGLGWASGNVIRFDHDAANFPLWFIRTTLQAPPTDPVDHYTIQIRGDS